MTTNFPGSNPSATYDLFEAMRQIIYDYMNNYVATVQPVVVKSVKDGGLCQIVDVAPVLRRTTTARKVLPITDDDIVPGVPVLTVAAGESSIIVKAAVEDYGLLIACKNDISKFKETGAEADIASPRKFSWSDGFFLPLSMQAADVGVYIKDGAQSIQIADGVIKVIGDMQVTGNLTVSGKGTFADVETPTVGPSTLVTGALAGPASSLGPPTPGSAGPVTPAIATHTHLVSGIQTGPSSVISGTPNQT